MSENRIIILKYLEIRPRYFLKLRDYYISCGYREKGFKGILERLINVGYIRVDNDGLYHLTNEGKVKLREHFPYDYQG